MGSFLPATLLTFALLCGTLTAAEVPGTAATPPAPAVTVPFQLRSGYAIVAETTIQGRTVKALIDTGMNPSVVDKGLARDLHLPQTGTAQVSDIQLGPIHRRNVSARIRDLRFTRPYLRTRIQAIIGMDVLAVMSFSIDYANKELRFGPVAPYTPAVAFISGPPQVTVAVKIGDQQLTMLVDTGTSGLMLFETGVASHHLPRQFMNRTISRNLEREFAVHSLAFRAAQIGDSTFPISGVTVSEDWPEWNGTFDGLLGLAATQFKRVTFDLETGTLRWEP